MSPKARSSASDKYPYAKRLREFLSGKKNSDISEMTGVSLGAVADYMSGRQKPSADFLSGLTKHGLDVHYILTGNRAAPDIARPNLASIPGAGFERFAKCVGLLAELGALSQGSPDDVAVFEACLQAFERELSEDLKTIKDGQKRTARGDSPAVQAG